MRSSGEYKSFPDKYLFLPQNATIVYLSFPVKTNERAFLAFYLQVPLNKKETGVKHYHLEEGKSYFVNTSGFHTAVNYGDDNRYHIVGVRYENSTDRPH